MFRELHQIDRGMREMGLAEKMAERRAQSLARTRKPSFIGRMARTLFAPAMTADSYQAEGPA